jgi:hypothetical protein
MDRHDVDRSSGDVAASVIWVSTVSISGTQDTQFAIAQSTGSPGGRRSPSVNPPSAGPTGRNPRCS